MRTLVSVLGLGLGLALAPAACGGDVKVDQSSFCLRWTDGGVAEPDTVPDGLACAIVARGAKQVVPTGKKSEPWGDGWSLQYLCVEASAGTCPTPSAIGAELDGCVAHREGEGCDHPISGACTTTRLWSACGPDPDARGGCCYFAYVSTSTILSTVDTPRDERLACNDLQHSRRPLRDEMK